jgi:hypothetical protein
MSATLPVTPLRHQPSFEQPDGDGAATSNTLIEALLAIQETTFRDSWQALRALHAKSHGRCLIHEPRGNPHLPA